ncbi:MAG: hypothetical protein K2Y32_18000 [Candidatus Obscuribacterales bacterium]|nr:hypothetical protein [Candidatus Obscuribacterales bacterium]
MESEDSESGSRLSFVLSSRKLWKEDCEALSALIKGLYKVASGWQSRGKLQCARRIYEFILARQGACSIPISVEILMSEANLALICLREKHFHESEAHFQRCIELSKCLLHEETEILQNLIDEYVGLLRKMGLYGQADFFMSYSIGS